MALKTPYPEAENLRTHDPSWFVGIFYCTRRVGTSQNGCILNRNFLTEHNGSPTWICLCCATHYDLSGRMVIGLSRRNLDLPPYAFYGDDKLVLSRYLSAPNLVKPGVIPVEELINS